MARSSPPVFRSTSQTDGFGPFGMREFALADVDNNLVRVGASIRRPSRGPTAGL